VRLRGRDHHPDPAAHQLRRRRYRPARLLPGLRGRGVHERGHRPVHPRPRQREVRQVDPGRLFPYGERRPARRPPAPDLPRSDARDRSTRSARDPHDRRHPLRGDGARLLFDPHRRPLERALRLPRGPQGPGRARGGSLSHRDRPPRRDPRQAGPVHRGVRRGRALRVPGGRFGPRVPDSAIDPGPRRAQRPSLAFLHGDHPEGPGDPGAAELADRREQGVAPADARARGHGAHRARATGLGPARRGPGRGVAAEAGPDERDIERRDRPPVRRGEGGRSVRRQDHGGRRGRFPPPPPPPGTQPSNSGRPVADDAAARSDHPEGSRILFVGR